MRSSRNPTRRTDLGLIEIALARSAAIARGEMGTTSLQELMALLGLDLQSSDAVEEAVPPETSS